MQYHLDRTLRLNTETKHASLYAWSIVETDANNKATLDQIPWDWTIVYTATECILGDVLTSTRGLRKEEGSTIEERQTIRIRLRPGIWDEGRLTRVTHHSMFGTDRSVENIWLHIHSHPDEEATEVCEAWGCVSYTMEVDFRTSIEPDTILFTLVVKPNTFYRYAETIRHGHLDKIIFSAGHVAGFYSEWSPSISTRHIKVLARGEEQTIEGEVADGIKPPRLGNLAEWSLSVSRQPALREPIEPSTVVAVEEPSNSQPPDQLAPVTMIAPDDPRARSLLRSIEIAAWCMVGLLAFLAYRQLAH